MCVYVKMRLYVYDFCPSSHKHISLFATENCVQHSIVSRTIDRSQFAYVISIIRFARTHLR